MRATAITSLLFVFIAGAVADSKETVTHLTGSGNKTTQTFEVKAPWIVDWRVNSDYPQSMAIEISLVDGDTGFHSGRIIQTKIPDDGVMLFRQSGRYRFRISAMLTYWDLKVQELTEQEAEAYTPK